MSFFDTHTHLDYLVDMTKQPLSDLLEESLQVGVQKILIVAVLAKDFKTIEKMTALFPDRLYYGVGLHPLYIEKHQYEDLVLLEQHLTKRDPRCTAVAEIGLERAIPALLTDVLWRKQCEFFETQLQLAKQFGLPVNLHSRHSQDQLFPFLKRLDLPKRGVIHGFSGSYEQAKRFVDLGYKIGVGGVITYERANKTRQTIKRLPLDCLLLETDSPDMPISGFQGQANHPKRLVQVFHTLCSLRNESAEKIEDVIWNNSIALFA